MAQTQHILAPCAHKQATHMVGQKLSDFINLTPWKADLQTGQRPHISDTQCKMLKINEHHALRHRPLHHSET